MVERIIIIIIITIRKSLVVYCIIIICSRLIICSKRERIKMLSSCARRRLYERERTEIHFEKSWELNRNSAHPSYVSILNLFESAFQFSLVQIIKRSSPPCHFIWVTCVVLTGRFLASANWNVSVPAFNSIQANSYKKDLMIDCFPSWTQTANTENKSCEMWW